MVRRIVFQEVFVLVFFNKPSLIEGTSRRISNNNDNSSMLLILLAFSN